MSAPPRRDERARRRGNAAAISMVIGPAVLGIGLFVVARRHSVGMTRTTG